MVGLALAGSSDAPSKPAPGEAPSAEAALFDELPVVEAAALPFDALKIDRSFTVDLDSPDGSIEVVRTILAMAHKASHGCRG